MRLKCDILSFCQAYKARLYCANINTLWQPLVNDKPQSTENAENINALYLTSPVTHRLG